MKNTFRRRGELNGRTFEQIISEMRDGLNELVEGKAEKEDIILYTRKLIKDAKPLDKNPSMMFWGLDEPQKMPSDSRVLFFYTPSYIAVSILAFIRMHGPCEATELEGFEDTLKRGLLGATGRTFSGSGHDAIIGLIDAMEIFSLAGMHKFVKEYPDVCPTFTSVFLYGRSILEERLNTGSVQNGWGQDFTKEAESVINSMKDTENGAMIFVYGTLLYGNSNHSYFLKESRYMGDAVLHDHALYNLGSYPGIKNREGNQVKGEVYYVDKETLKRINNLEGEGSLYALKKREVEMDGVTVPDVGVYEYLHEVEDKNLVKLEDQPWGKKENGSEDLVWYVSYGSNMLYERFLCYIRGGFFRNSVKNHKECVDETLPKAKMTYSIPYDMYYGNESRSWDGRGVSFLDTTKPGKAYGVAYLITRTQFKHLWRQENGGSTPQPESWYGCDKKLGTYHNIPVRTVTNCGVVGKNEASALYKQILREGLRENYPQLHDYRIEEYVESRNRNAEIMK